MSGERTDKTGGQPEPEMTEPSQTGRRRPTSDPAVVFPDADGTQSADASEQDAVDGTDTAGPSVPADGGSTPETAPPPRAAGSRWRRPSSASLMIGVLLAALGFSLVVQMRSTSTDGGLAATRQEDLVRILSDLESQEQRVRQEIADLEESQRQLSSGAQGRRAALEEATRRADELGILAGGLPARGPGLRLRFTDGTKPISASAILNAVEELRGAGAEAMQISGGGGKSVRIIASTYFLDEEGGGIRVDGRHLNGPYTISAIGDPTTMHTALNIPGGVVASVKGDGGNVIVEEREVVDVTTLSEPTDLRYAHPVS